MKADASMSSAAPGMQARLKYPGRFQIMVGIGELVRHYARGAPRGLTGRCRLHGCLLGLSLEAALPLPVPRMPQMKAVRSCGTKQQLSES